MVNGQIKQVRLSELKPYKNNARFHQPWQVEKIINSIKEHGWTVPMIVDENYNILAGHGRYMAAGRMGLSEVEVRVVSGWTEEQKKAYVLKDNQLTECSEWNEELLKSEIESLIEVNYNIESLGFDDAYLARLLADVQEAVNTAETPGLGSTESKTSRVLRVTGDAEELKYLATDIMSKNFGESLQCFFEVVNES